MPKVSGKNLEECMENCMSDAKTKEEYPSTEKRRQVCYAACKSKYEPIDLKVLVDKYKDKE